MSYLKDLIDKLGDSGSAVRLEAVRAVNELAMERKRIEPAFPALSGLLSDEDPEIRRLAADSLWNAADNGQDIKESFRALSEAFRKEKDLGVKVTIAGAFSVTPAGCAYLDHALSVLEKALGHSEKETVETATIVLAEYLEKRPVSLRRLSQIGRAAKTANARLGGNNQELVEFITAIGYGKEELKEQNLLATTFKPPRGSNPSAAKGIRTSRLRTC